MSSMSFVLTVSESKRLIAKAVAQMLCVREALRRGTVAIGKGSTNAYVVEEILGRPIDKAQYLTGNTQPRHPTKQLTHERMGDIVLVDGQELAGAVIVEVVKQMKPGDVFVKGANALSADRSMAGVLIGDPNGGTVGATIGRTYGSRVIRIIPVGLEKTISGDILSAASRIEDAGPSRGGVPTLWPVRGRIVTEIEALELLCGARATHIGSGGINGAEGAVWLLIEGDDAAVDRAGALIDGVQGEPPFGER